MRPRHFLSFLDLSGQEAISVLDLAGELKQEFAAGALRQALAGKSVAAIWDAEGFRNRASFELGIQAMGGRVVQVPGRLDEREPVEDVAKYLSNWFDLIVVRTREHSVLMRLAEAALVPVVNARTGHNHPCEVLGDLAFIRSVRGDIGRLKLVFVGEVTNLCHSWFEVAVRLPLAVVQVCPEGYEVSNAFLGGIGLESNGAVSHDLRAAVRGADVVYTDVWPSGADEDERKRIRDLFLPYQVTPEVLDVAEPDALFLPCPPVHRGEEVSAEAMDSRQCRVYEAKDWLLHAQNALLIMLAEAKGM